MGYLAWLFLCQTFATADFADLMTFVVAAGRALAAVVLLLAADALAAPFPLLLVRLLVVEAHAGRRLLRPEPIAGFTVGAAVPQAVTRGGRCEEKPGDV